MKQHRPLLLPGNTACILDKVSVEQQALSAFCLSLYSVANINASHPNSTFNELTFVSGLKITFIVQSLESLMIKHRSSSGGTNSFYWLRVSVTGWRKPVYRCFLELKGLTFPSFR
ncbi:hypothetical protein ILYODFUR_012859 [Ilyodon furcidens]|uniref:Uncharacterized protein n=1 Tax=Ilyodon furcidens TaxID=33524 RepID=A0ABV0TI53_9TELE